MSWWNRYNDARMLFVVICDGVYRDAFGAYQDAGRRISRGQYESYRYTKFTVSIHSVSDVGVLPRLPDMGWQTLPPNLAELLANTDTPPLETFSMQSHLERARGYRELPDSGLTAPPLPLPPVATLGPDWDQLFPDDAIIEGMLLREDLRRVLNLRASNPARYRADVLQRTGELTQVVVCQNELPIWDVLAAESEEDALADVEERFGIAGTTWSDVRNSKAFLRKTARRSGAIVARGMQGLIWLQLAGSLPQDTGFRECVESGCTNPVAERRRNHCEEHALEIERKNSARLSREYRERTKWTR